MIAIRKLWCVVLLLITLVLLTNGRPQEIYGGGNHASERQEDAGRVQIKVYRGPTQRDGTAPWGFWVKQPSDDNE